MCIMFDEFSFIGL